VYAFFSLLGIFGSGCGTGADLGVGEGFTGIEEEDDEDGEDSPDDLRHPLE